MLLVTHYSYLAVQYLECVSDTGCTRVFQKLVGSFCLPQLFDAFVYFFFSCLDLSHLELSVEYCLDVRMMVYSNKPS